MSEALWVQAAGVDYTAIEDRKLMSAIWTPGVIHGMGLAAGTGLQVVVAAGACMVDDASGGGFLCYFTESTTVTVPASTTSSLYCNVDLTTGAATLSTTASGRSQLIGSVTAGASSVSSVSRATGLNATIKAGSGGSFLRRDAGAPEAERAVDNVPFFLKGFTVDAGPAGAVRLGNRQAYGLQFYSQARFRVWASRYSAQSIPISNNAFYEVPLTALQGESVNESGVSGTGLSGGRIKVPYPGLYMCTGQSALDAYGLRGARFSVYSPTGVLRRHFGTTGFPSALSGMESARWLSVAALVYVPDAGGTISWQLQHIDQWNVARDALSTEVQVALLNAD